MELAEANFCLKALGPHQAVGSADAATYGAAGRLLVDTTISADLTNSTGSDQQRRLSSKSQLEPRSLLLRLASCGSGARIGRRDDKPRKTP